ncbi:CpsD/CapB family tyrosine-protein kinase [Citreimonas salinaria]|uniref:CpsD/CapB family tyrosine-protein kinase n=1 Tax=Citreimonas salinaria TaxID=321339 RepID=UPI001FE1C5F1|nr:CpsD/CapB family tyrosine-protein kinase [Citreimonas salinaria]
MANTGDASAPPDTGPSREAFDAQLPKAAGKAEAHPTPPDMEPAPAASPASGARRVRLAALPKAELARVLRRVRGQGPAIAAPPQEERPEYPPRASPTPGERPSAAGARGPVTAAEPQHPQPADAPPATTPAAADDDPGDASGSARDADAMPALPRQEAPETPPAAQELARPAHPPATPRTDSRTSSWDALGRFTASSAHLDRHRIVAARRDDPAHAAFDMLRTRLLQALSDNGWKRVAITSPTARCGKTFTAANLAISLSRQENCRTVMLDLDLRRPSLHTTLGHADPAAIGAMLRGEVAPSGHLLRLGQNDFDGGHNLAIGFNGRREPYAAELMQDPRTADTLSRIEAELAPDVMLFDLPPALYTDDVMALRPHFDGVILVIGGGITTPKEVKSVERRMGDRVPLLCMVLNMAEDSDVRHYPY